MFSCEFCEISKNTYLYRTPLVAAFVSDKLTISNNQILKLIIQVLKHAVAIFITRFQFKLNTT